MTDKIPAEILARKDDSPEEFKAQQDRIAAYVQEKRAIQAAIDAAEQAKREGK